MPLIDSARKTVAAAGTRVQLSATAIQASWVTLQGLSANTQPVAVGTKSVVAASGTEVGTLLDAKQAVTLPITDLTEVWVDSRVNGEGVLYTYGS